MTEPIRIYVGTDPRSAEPDRALENSVRANTDREVEFHWMRAGEGRWKGWHQGPDPEKVSRGKWATMFSNFRMCVPEAAGFFGKAIYMDSDMIVLGDVGELYDLMEPNPAKPYLCTCEKRSEPAVIWAGHKFWRDLAHWPSIHRMREQGWTLWQYRQLLIKNNMLDPSLPPEWNCLDGQGIAKAKLIHFTKIDTQPWKPWPEIWQYRDHPCREAVSLWESYRDA